MQATHHFTLGRDSHLRLIRLALAASWFLATVTVAPAFAAEPGTVARPPAAREVALREADRQSEVSKLVDDNAIFRIPALEEEPLRDLIDKYAPSAIEWSMLPRFAGPSKSARRHEAAAG